MSEKTNERLENEAREALVAADLSAKMKQWRGAPPPPSGGTGWLRLLIMLLAFGGAAWWFWPQTKVTQTPAPAPPASPSTPVPAPSAPAAPAAPEPMAGKPGSNKYLALAQTSYQAPDFTADIRGDVPRVQDALNDARRALAEHRPADALEALQQAPAEYQTDADYLRAHALFAQRKYAQSATVFGQLRGSVRYGEAAQWYEILALLPGFEHNKALVLDRLKTIADDNGHTFQREATRLKVLLDK